MLSGIRLALLTAAAYWADIFTELSTTTRSALSSDEPDSAKAAGT